MLQNALTDDRRRQAGQMHQRGLSMAGRREVSVVDLAAPEAAVVVGRINTRLSHKATDRLVQVRLLGGVARARQVWMAVAQMQMQMQMHCAAWQRPAAPATYQLSACPGWLACRTC
jgi:hypothetical protein